MATNFEDRWRGTLAEARAVAELPTNVITHLLDNQDGTFSVMSHIVCEHCDYCNSQGDCRVGGIDPVPAKQDAYELVGRQ